METPRFYNFYNKIGLIFVVLIFWIHGVVSLDPDLGWHLKMGELIFKSGIPTLDPFSYTMPTYPFVDHEWLTNLFIYILFPHIGIIGLSLIFTSIVIATLLLVMPKTHRHWRSAPFFLSAAALLPIAGIRPQLLSWLFMAFLIKILINLHVWQKWRFCLPLLFLGWVNLHGGFSAGVMVLATFITLKSWRLKKVEMSELLILLLSLGATFINPYNFRVWWEVWQQISDGSLHFFIAEWLPSVLHPDLIFWFLIALSVILILKFRSKLRLEILGIYLGLLLAALSSIRHIPFWIIFNLSILSSLLGYLYEEASKKAFGAVRFNKVANILYFTTLAGFLVQSVLVLPQSYSFNENNFYPQKAVQFLKTQKIEGEIFSSYGWGGYLILKLPEKKVFIDGRMPSWRRDQSPQNESLNAAKDYRYLTNENSNPGLLFDQYNINYLLWPNPKSDNSWIGQDNSWIGQITNQYQKSLNQIFNLKSIPSIIKRLEERGWIEIYRDSNSIIYKRP